MTLMSCGNSDGVRRCDERCYGATGGTCDCVCGGANHGKGLAQALQNTAKLAEELLDQHGYEIEVTDACHQQDMFLKPEVVLRKKKSPWD